MYVFFFKQKTAYELRISDWSSDVCSSDLCNHHRVIASEAKQSRAVTARSGLPRRLRLLAMTSRKMETMVFHLRYFRNDPKAYLVLNRQTPPGTNASGQAMKERTRPMIDIRKFDTLGHADHAWLEARHHFSFASYHDPKRMGWGALRVWNDDAIAAQSG